MRLVRLVAAGLVLGALAGFLGALLRPRSVHSYHPVPVDQGPVRADAAQARPPVGVRAAGGDSEAAR